ncbi:glycosyltransferase [Kineococcus auxinigenes]|uniref:glycosyltransferase n=1 Tax=unclassified Kineococcus TaxID=2621656 RepID=UPI003D7E7E12
MRNSRLPRRSKLLLVSSIGGHLTELLLVSKILEANADSRWVTAENDQSTSLLADRPVTYLPYVAPRDWRTALSVLPEFHRLLREEHYDAVVSTGAAVAVPAMLAARSLGVPAHYVESVSRFRGTSMTGRLVSGIPGVGLYTQHPERAQGRWRHDVSIADSLARRSAPRRKQGPPRIFVTLGTIRPYRFDALVDRVLKVLPPSAEVTWQLGVTARNDLPGTVRDYVTNAEFSRLAREATAVVTHAGVGSVLQLLEQGVEPVVVPRRAARGEHVDDHQMEAVDAFTRIGIATCRQVEDISTRDLVGGTVVLPRTRTSTLPANLQHLA